MADTLTHKATQSATSAHIGAPSATAVQQGAQSPTLARNRSYSATFTHIHIGQNGQLVDGPSLLLSPADWDGGMEDLLQVLTRNHARYTQACGHPPNVLLICPAAEAALLAHPRAAALAPPHRRASPGTAELAILCGVRHVVVGDGDLHSLHSAALVQATCYELRHRIEMERNDLCRQVDNLRATMTAFRTAAEHAKGDDTDWTGLFEVLEKLCPTAEMVGSDFVSDLMASFSAPIVRAIADLPPHAVAAPAHDMPVGDLMARAIWLAGMGGTADAAEHAATAEALAGLAAADPAFAPALQAFTRHAPGQRTPASRPGKPARRATGAMAAASAAA